MNDDRDLREAFARLREIDAESTPRFAMPCVQPRPRRRMIPAIAVVLLLVTSLVVYITRPKVQPAHPEIRIESWRAPTDFLLKTPGAELTSSVPHLQPQLPKIQGDRS